MVFIILQMWCYQALNEGFRIKETYQVCSEAYRYLSLGLFYLAHVTFFIKHVLDFKIIWSLGNKLYVLKFKVLKKKSQSIFSAGYKKPKSVIQ